MAIRTRIREQRVRHLVSYNHHTIIRNRGARSISDLYLYIGPPRVLCLAMMCRLVWTNGAYTAAPLVDWRSVNGGQYAQTKTVGIIRFVTHLFYLHPNFKWVPASNYRYCIN